MLNSQLSEFFLEVCYAFRASGRGLRRGLDLYVCAGVPFASAFLTRRLLDDFGSEVAV